MGSFMDGARGSAAAAAPTACCRGPTRLLGRLPRTTLGEGGLRLSATFPRTGSGTRTPARVRPLVRFGRRRWSGRTGRRAAADAALLAVAAAFVLPLVWLVLASFDGRANLRVRMPDPVTLDNYAAVWTGDITFRPILNSLLLCGGATLVTVVCAALAAYPLSRFQSRFSRPYLLTILFSTCLPITAVMVPVYGLFVRINLIDTLSGTALFMAAAQLPFAIWMMKNFMDGIPKVLEEAAWTDGAGWVQTLLRVILPLMGPGVAVVMIYSFVIMWGNFFVPFLLLLTPDQLPASVTVFTFFGNYGSVVYGQLAAFSLIYSTPVLVLYLLISRRLGGGFALGGAVKG
jgi:multiple sugar transport system permease protein